MSASGMTPPGVRAELHRDPLDPGDAAMRSPVAAAGEGDLAHPRIGARGVAQLAARTGEALDALGRSPASSRISMSLSAVQGRSVAGLTTTALPAASAGPTLCSTSSQREVERGDRHHHAARHPEREPEAARRRRRAVQRHALAVELGSLDPDAAAGRPRARLRPRLGDRLAPSSRSSGRGPRHGCRRCRRRAAGSPRARGRWSGAASPHRAPRPRAPGRRRRRWRPGQCRARLRCRGCAALRAARRRSIRPRRTCAWRVLRFVFWVRSGGQSARAQPCQRWVASPAAYSRRFSSSHG